MAVEVVRGIFVGKDVARRFGLEGYPEREARLMREEEEHRKLIESLNTPQAKEDINYSDIFKDVYGFRPRY